MKLSQIILQLPLLLLLGCGGGNSQPPDNAAPDPIEPAPVVTPEPQPEVPVAPDPIRQKRVNWGTHPQQYAMLYYPAEAGAPLPVIIMLHGGCWQSVYTVGLQADLSQALAQRGFAVWNVEYRSLGNGGEWPVMFQDVAAAADYLPVIAAEYNLDLDAVATMGHSAGGHLALWLASRHRIDVDSPLYKSQPQPVHGVVTLGGIADLESGSCAGGAAEIIAGNTLTAEMRVVRLGHTSPIAMLPTAVTTILISGSRDSIVPPAVSQNYVAAAVQVGDYSEHLIIDGAGHFDLINSGFMDMALLEDSVLRAILTTQ